MLISYFLMLQLYFMLMPLCNIFLHKFNLQIRFVSKSWPLRCLRDWTWPIAWNTIISRGNNVISSCNTLSYQMNTKWTWNYHIYFIQFVAIICSNEIPDVKNQVLTTFELIALCWFVMWMFGTFLWMSHSLLFVNDLNCQKDNFSYAIYCRC